MSKPQWHTHDTIESKYPCGHWGTETCSQRLLRGNKAHHDASGAQLPSYSLLQTDDTQHHPLHAYHVPGI